MPSTLGIPEVFADHKTAGSVVRHLCCFFVKESKKVKEGVFAVGEVEKEI